MTKHEPCPDISGAKLKRGRQPLVLVEAERARPCSRCRQPTVFATSRGRALHPACGYGFELFHPEAETGIDAGIESCLDSLGALVVRVESW